MAIWSLAERDLDGGKELLRSRCRALEATPAYAALVTMLPRIPAVLPARRGGFHVEIERGTRPTSGT
jgi:hypothetical protein